MARTVAQIKQYLVDRKAEEAALNGLTTDSSVSIWGLLLYVNAVGQAILEQMLDLFRIEIETKIDSAAPNNAQWLKSKVLAFQYSDTDPQIVDVNEDPDNFSVKYPVINSALRIVTRCSIRTNANKQVLVKVAKFDPPVQLASGEASSLQAYVELISPPGIVYTVVNLVSDKIFIDAEIYYNGQYASVISANVIAAIKTYLASLPFDGNVKVSNVEDAIQSVTGVTDVKIKTIKCRKDATALASATVVYDLATGINNKKYETVSGYIVEETTASNTFADTLQFIPG
jgi:hypothetical protein